MYHLLSYVTVCFPKAFKTIQAKNIVNTYIHIQRDMMNEKGKEESRRGTQKEREERNKTRKIKYWRKKIPKT